MCCVCSVALTQMPSLTEGAEMKIVACSGVLQFFFSRCSVDFDVIQLSPKPCVAGLCFQRRYLAVVV